MSEEIRVARPQPTAPRADLGGEPTRSGGSSKMPWVILVIVILVILVLGALFRDKLFGKNANTSGDKAASSTMYQAVFLTNGQVYFGKLSNVNGDYVDLSDIYYLQVVQQPIQGTPQEQQQAQQSISLVKLGQELHGPVDEMHISRSQILFYEDLKSDGNVVKAIDDYKNKQSAPAK